MSARLCMFGLMLGLVLTTRTADANGRYPESNQIFFSDSDPNLVLLRVTFGLLVSHDRGGHWQWVCESSIGMSANEDPMYALTPSGSILASTYTGLAITTNGACDWTFAGGILQHQTLIDLASAPADRAHVVTLSSVYRGAGDAGAGVYDSKLFATNDEGKSFTQVSTFESSLAVQTVDLAPSDPARIYVSAGRDVYTADDSAPKTPRGFLLASTDRGTTWQETPIPLVNGERLVFIAGVDPNDARRVYLRTDSNGGPSRLLVVDGSPDGGAPQVRSILEASGPLRAFALSADGGTVFVGGPQDGIQSASTRDFAFTQKSKLGVQCLAVSTDGLWACAEQTEGFIVGRSLDDGATFEPKATLCSIGGSLDCAAGTKTASVCAPQWSLQQAMLGCGSTADAGPRPTAPTKGGATEGGGCGCSTTPTRSYAALGVAAAVLALVSRRARRRSRDRANGAG